MQTLKTEERVSTNPKSPLKYAQSLSSDELMMSDIELKHKISTSEVNVCDVSSVLLSAIIMNVFQMFIWGIWSYFSANIDIKIIAINYINQYD